ncbi:MAG: insulinase family protein [Thermodesulfovibrionales bacterium]|nr:insulinase family protein [Thermodesulfovibrionales bacterium]
MTERNNLLGLILLFVLVLTSLTLCNSNLAEAIQYKKTVFSNGLTLLHVERKSIPAVMVNILIEASPLQEPAEMAGLANLTAKTITDGTKTLTSKEINEIVDSMGTSLTTSVSYDYTTISLTTLKKNINRSLDILSKVLLDPSFDNSEIERKKQIIIGSLRQSHEEPSFLINKEFRSIIYGDFPYGRLIEGSSETISKIKREDIIKFYKTYYRPDKSIISVVGDITYDEAVQLIKKYLLSWSSESAPTDKTNKMGVSQINLKGFKIIDRDLTQANIIFGHLGIERQNEDFYAVSVLNYILGGGGFASRLMKTVRDDLGLTYGISSHFTTNKHKGLFSIEVQTKNESAGQVLREILKQIKDIQSNPVSDDELKDAKAFLVGSFPRRFETNRKIADFLPLIEFYRLGDDYIEKYEQYINSVTKEDIMRVAKKYLTQQDYTVVIAGKKELLKDVTPQQ